LPDAYISGFGTALPPAVSTERFLAVDREMRRRHGQPPDIHETVARLARGTGIRARHSLLSAWWEGAAQGDTEIGPVEDILSETDFDPPFWERMRIWRSAVPPMAALAARRAIEAWGGSPRDISHIVTTNTSGWAEPGVACHVIHALGLPDDCAKAELNFNGCFCGATCLRLARDIVRAGESKYVLVVAAEAASLHTSPVDTDISTLVASVLFADGAAAMVVGPEGTWRFDRAGMRLVPDSDGLLGMVPPVEEQQQSYRMFLHREVGARLGTYFRSGAGRQLLDWMGDGGLPALAVHPGGPNILENVEGVLLERGYPADVLASSFDTMRSCGNLGSAAILFVLARTLPHLKSDRLGTLAFGPGVTVEWGMLSRSA
jgi:predicted naringenin-chalcone synthase